MDRTAGDGWKLGLWQGDDFSGWILGWLFYIFLNWDDIYKYSTILNICPSQNWFDDLGMLERQHTLGCVWFHSVKGYLITRWWGKLHDFWWTCITQLSDKYGWGPINHCALELVDGFVTGSICLQMPAIDETKAGFPLNFLCIEPNESFEGMDIATIPTQLAFLGWTENLQSPLVFEVSNHAFLFWCSPDVHPLTHGFSTPITLRSWPLKQRASSLP